MIHQPPSSDHRRRNFDGDICSLQLQGQEITLGPPNWFIITRTFLSKSFSIILIDTSSVVHWIQSKCQRLVLSIYYQPPTHSKGSSFNAGPQNRTHNLPLPLTTISLSVQLPNPLAYVALSVHVSSFLVAAEAPAVSYQIKWPRWRII